MPKVSVIIPCYNQGHYIKETIDSVLRQTFDNFEIIVINDGSTDEQTIQVLKSLKLSKGKVIHTVNQGLAAARNNGIYSSSGKYILPLDADDKIAPQYLEKAVKVLESNKSVKIVYSKAAYFGLMQGEWILPEFSWEQMLQQNLIFCSALFRKSDFDKTQGYNSNMKYGWEDWDLWLSILESGGAVLKLDDVLFYYRKHDTSMVGSIESNKSLRQFLEHQLILNHLEIYKKYFPEPLTLLRELEHLRYEKKQFEKYKAEIYASLSYRIGDAILKPFKVIGRKFK